MRAAAARSELLITARAVAAYQALLPEASRSTAKSPHLDAGVAERRQARPLVALDVILQQQPRALPHLRRRAVDTRQRGGGAVTTGNSGGDCFRPWLRPGTPHASACIAH